MLHSMVKNCFLRSLRVSSFVLIFLNHAVHGQSLKEVSVHTFDAEVVAISVDFQKHIYVALTDNQLIKLDELGEELASFSQPNLGPFTSVAGQNSLNPFFFVRDNQQVVFLDRFLANPVIYDLNQWTSSFVWLAAPSVDRQLWLLESNPFRIAKVDRFTGNVLHEVFIQIGLEIEDLVFFKAQQQYLILVDQHKGIYLFDLFGNLVRHIVEENVTSVQLIDDRLIYFLETSLVQLELRSGSRTEVSLPYSCDKVIKNGEFYLCFGSDEMTRWVRPKK